MTSRRPQIIRRLVAGSLVAAGAVAMLTACTPMASAGSRSVTLVEAAVGDLGDVSVSTAENGINVSPRCDIGVHLHEGVDPSEIATLILALGDVQLEEPCTFDSFGLANGSNLNSDDWDGISEPAAAELAVQMQSISSLWLNLHTDEPNSANAQTEGGTLSDGAAFVRRIATEGARLEAAVGPVMWSAQWSYDDHIGVILDVTSDVTPRIEIADALDGIAALDSTSLGAQEADGIAQPNDAVVRMTVETIESEGTLSATVDLTVDDWTPTAIAGQEEALAAASLPADVAAAILTIFDPAVFDGGVSVIANELVTWHSS